MTEDTPDIQNPDAPAEERDAGTTALGRVYAKALLQLADEHDQTDEIAQEVRSLSSLVRENTQLRHLFESPAISPQQRADAVRGIFQGRITDTTYKFLQVLSRNDRLDALPQVIGAFNQLLAERRGIVEVDAYVATPLDDATQAEMARSLGHALGDKQVVLRQHVDESLIGGLKIRVGDQLVDGSVAAQLRLIRRRLTKAGQDHEMAAIEEGAEGEVHG